MGVYIYVVKRGIGGDGARRKKGKSKEEVPKRRMTASNVSAKVRVRRGETVCFDAFWGHKFHLKCMGMKEGAEVMKGEEFVCHFCVSLIMLSLREDIIGLRRE